MLTVELPRGKLPGGGRGRPGGAAGRPGALSFYRATELASQGRLRQARQAALEGLPGGGPRDAAGLLALLVAPSTAARLERLTRRHRVPIEGYRREDTPGVADGDA